MMAPVGNVATGRVDLALTTEQLNMIAINGQRDAAAGRVVGDQLYGPKEHGKLDNATVRVLNTLISNLRADPIDAGTIDGIINGTTDSTHMHERFGDIFFYLAETQIYAQKGEDGKSADAYSVGYPLRDALEKLEQHKIRESDYVGTKIWNGEFIKGPLAGEDLPVWDFMFDDDDEIINSFWYIIKMISLVI